MRSLLSHCRGLLGYPAYYQTLAHALRTPDRRRLVVMGNAPLHYDCSALVDLADVVVRLNDCKGAGPRSGTRTTVLCVNNLGSPAREYVDGALFRRFPCCRDASEFWFPRNQLVHDLHAARVGGAISPGEHADFSAAIIAANALAARTIVHFTAAFNETVISTLQQVRHRYQLAETAWSPSTGMFAIAHVLSAPEFREHEVHLLGFRFQGWSGHHWAAERRLIAEYVREGRVTLHLT